MNGTIINSRLIRKRRAYPLSNNSQLTFGSKICRFVNLLDNDKDIQNDRLINSENSLSKADLSIIQKDINKIDNGYLNSNTNGVDQSLLPTQEYIPDDDCDVDIKDLEEKNAIQNYCEKIMLNDTKRLNETDINTDEINSQTQSQSKFSSNRADEEIEKPRSSENYRHKRIKDDSDKTILRITKKYKSNTLNKPLKAKAEYKIIKSKFYLLVLIRIKIPKKRRRLKRCLALS